MSKTPLRAFWCRTPSRPNFGDALTPWFIYRLTGTYPRFVWPEAREDKYIVCGSIAARAGAACIVWGAGLMAENERISPQARFLAVRGPRTRARAIECGADCPPILGDPALLLPRLLRPPERQRCGVGLVPHFSDRVHISDSWASDMGLTLIDVQQQVEDVVDQVAGCDWTLSSSLHGLIVAHAYGIPAVWVQRRPLPSGDGVKFADYFESLNHEPVVPVPIEPGVPLDWRVLERSAWCPASVDTESLWRSCPFSCHDA